MAKATNSYRTEIVNKLLEYQAQNFPEWEGIFERGNDRKGRPPVFLKGQAWRNVLTGENVSARLNQELLSLVPAYERHRWFGSMTSSQALAQSILGNLTISGNMSLLNEIKGEDGQPIFGEMQINFGNFSFEKKVTHLGEPRSTSLDALISGIHPIAIECKFTEQEMGSCSRPHLLPAASNYQEAHCNGCHERQRGRKSRCSLTEIGVRYWEFIPQVFLWPNDADLNPCPLDDNYQLVRNLLAVAVNPDGSVSTRYCHVVLLYDERNPAFADGGKGFRSFKMTRDALRNPEMLKKCSWQKIILIMREKGIPPSLTKELSLKYGY